jgi:U6 snRNA-associated Sm-like protein LSm1
VKVLTNDGRVFTGILKSFDQRMNIILANCFEQVHSGKGKPVESEDMGVYFIRGDNITLLGRVEPSLKDPEAPGDEPIAPIQHY